MGQAPRELMPSRSALDYFGAQLRRWRVARGLSQDQLGRLTHHSGSMIGKVEKALRRPPPDLARRCDEILRTDGALVDLLPLVAPTPREPHLATDGTTDEPTPDDLGLRWSPDLAGTVEAVGRLWRADVERRSVVLGAAWSAVACAAPARDWLLGTPAVSPSRSSGRRIGQADVDACWSMCHTFGQLDHRLGGGHARTTLAQYLSSAVVPMLNGSYTDQTGSNLLTAAARLCDLGGFMAFDCRLHGLAQRYYIQALRLAHASGDRHIGAHVLADMSMQAHYLHRPPEALELARAGQRTARECGASAALARCSAMEARAHALAGDSAACAQAMNRAEQALDAVRGDEPEWIRFFNHEQLAAEFLYAAGDLGRTTDVQRFAPAVLESSKGMQRRLVLTTAALASSHLTTDPRTSDIDRACAVLRKVVPIASSLSSPRTIDALNAVRGRLLPYSGHALVKDLENEWGALTGAAT